MKSIAGGKTMAFITHELIDLRRQGRIHFSENLHQHVSWLDGVSKGNGYRYVGLRTQCPDGEITTIFYTTRRGPLHLIGSPLPACFCDHIPPFVTGEISRHIKTKLILSQMRFLARKGYHYVEGRLPDVYLPGDPLLCSPRTRVKKISTLLLDLTAGEDKLWKQMKGRSRNMIRKAQKNGVTLRALDADKETVDAFYSMLQSTYMRQGLDIPHRRSLYWELCKRLKAAGRIFMAGAEIEGKIEAVGLFPHDRSRIYFMSGTSTRKAMQLGANNLLQWEVIRYGLKRGLKSYDLGGTGVPSIDRFKKSIGGVPFSYNRIVWFSPVADLANRIRGRIVPIVSSLKESISLGGL